MGFDKKLEHEFFDNMFYYLSVKGSLHQKFRNEVYFKEGICGVKPYRYLFPHAK